MGSPDAYGKVARSGIPSSWPRGILDAVIAFLCEAKDALPFARRNPGFSGAKVPAMSGSTERHRCCCSSRDLLRNRQTDLCRARAANLNRQRCRCAR